MYNNTIQPLSKTYISCHKSYITLPKDILQTKTKKDKLRKMQPLVH